MSAESSLPRKSPLLEKTRQLMRARHMSIRTEEAYLRWIEEFLRFQRDKVGKWVHPGELGSLAVTEYLTHLAVHRKVAASTQNQAFSGSCEVLGG
jgi:hypothetical protein